MEQALLPATMPSYDHSDTTVTSDLILNSEIHSLDEILLKQLQENEFFENVRHSGELVAEESSSQRSLQFQHMFEDYLMGFGQ